MAGLQGANAQRASQPSTTYRLMDLPITDICNQGGHWMAPIGTDRQMQESPVGFMDVEVGFENCLYRIASRGLPEERRTALCLLELAGDSCADGDDAWCIDALLRSATDVIPEAGKKLAASLEPGPMPVASHRSLDQLRKDVHAEFSGTIVYQDAMLTLKTELADLTGLDLEGLTSPLTVANVVQVLRDNDSGEVVGATTMDRFDWAAKAEALRLGVLLGSIGQETINARPEHYRDDLGAELANWLDRNFPGDPAVPLTSHQRRHVLGLMVDYINGRIPARSSSAEATD
ncbi:MAG: hypothetical protein JHC82_06990 [Stenotrophomonas sp.]|nr:hypothetical protein [Stenotrophomonas sp.]